MIGCEDVTFKNILILGSAAVALAIMFVLSVLAGNSYGYITALLSLILIGIPALCIRKVFIVLPWPILLAIGLSLCLHNVGLVADLYMTTSWDILTHFISGITVASIVSMMLIMVIVSSKKTKVPMAWIPSLILVSVLALEGTWEILEFTIDTIMGTGMQHGLSDTMKDIVVNTLSGIVAGLGFTYYMSKASLQELVENMKVERLVEWSRRTFSD